MHCPSVLNDIAKGHTYYMSLLTGKESRNTHITTKLAMYTNSIIYTLLKINM